MTTRKKAATVKTGTKKLRLKKETLKDLNPKLTKEVRGGALRVEGDTETIPNACCAVQHTVFTDCEQPTCLSVGCMSAGCVIR